LSHATENLRIPSATLGQPGFESLKLVCASAQAGGHRKEHNGPDSLLLRRECPITGHYLDLGMGRNG